jgi:hypothetical protein
MNRGAAFRGQPLLLLAGLLAGWLAVRVTLWQPLSVPGGDAVTLAEAGGDKGRVTARTIEATGAAGATQALDSLSVATGAGMDPAIRAPILPAILSEPSEAVEEPIAPSMRIAPRAVIGHNLLLLAGLSQMEVPAALIAYLRAPPLPAPGIPAAAPMLAAAPPPATETASRWTADGWLLLRNDATAAFLGGRPSYGRSQAGAVVRYSLAPASALRPQAYLRASAALAGPREQEVAAGISVRPIARLPLRFAAEARVGETGLGTRVRPAAFAVTEFSPLRLPLGMRAEAYAQAGYVGGEYATAFADGQARVERPLLRRGETELSAGGGVWGGAQRGAARLDIGPTAAVSFRLGDARGRVAADYRFRLAGDAAPSSGPALTLSAGF